MPTPTNTAEFLSELNGGAFASQIGHALSEVAAGVVDHGKAGKLTITLDFSQIGESAQVKIKHKLDYKVPTKRGTRSENTSLDRRCMSAPAASSLYSQRSTTSSLRAMKRLSTHAPDHSSHQGKSHVS